jgi:hypothetical protein
MSINNIFARSKQVWWWNDQYEFRWPNGKSKNMSDVIAERGRESQILWTIKRKV